MSVALMKTKSELCFEDAFSKAAPKLPGGARVQALRKAALSRFAKLGLPSRRMEDWKYTDLRHVMREPLPLMLGQESGDVDQEKLNAALGPLGALDAYTVTFVDGAYRASLSQFDDANGLSVSSLAELLSAGKTDDLGLFDEKDFEASSVLDLNTAFASDGFVIKVRYGASIDKPVLIAHISSSKEPGWTASRNVIRVGKDACVTIIEVFVSLSDAAKNGQINTASDVEVSAGANLKHIKCVIERGEKVYLSDWIVKIREEARYRGFLFTTGAALARNQVRATFLGEDARLNVSGAFLASGSEHVDNTLVVDHKVPGCESRELFKGVLSGHARGVVQGKVIVRPDAQKTDGHQMAKALMLSPETEFDSKPELEIYADDVICGHGSTVADLDKDLLFYCRSRGIPQTQARSLLVRSFVGEALEAVNDEALQSALDEIVSTWVREI